MFPEAEGVQNDRIELSGLGAQGEGHAVRIVIFPESPSNSILLRLLSDEGQPPKAIGIFSAGAPASSPHHSELAHEQMLRGQRMSVCPLI